MKHPEPQQWMAFLYGEVDRDQRRDLDAHLVVCPDCSRRLARWRATVDHLDAAGVPARPAPARTWSPVALRAAAVLAVLALGFAFGRQGAVSPAQLDRRLGELRQQLTADLSTRRESDLRQVADASAEVARAGNREFLEAFLRRYQAARAEDREELLTLLQGLEKRRAEESTELRENLARLAASTGTGFEQTRHQMRWLTSYLPSTAPADGVPEPDAR